MDKHDGHVHLDGEQASGGRQEGVVRWILLGGLVLAIILLSVTWIVPAMMQGDVEEEATVSGEIQSMENDGSTTDSIVTDLGDDTDATATDQTAEEGGVETVEN